MITKASFFFTTSAIEWQPEDGGERGRMTAKQVLFFSISGGQEARPRGRAGATAVAVGAPATARAPAAPAPAGAPRFSTPRSTPRSTPPRSTPRQSIHARAAAPRRRRRRPRIAARRRAALVGSTAALSGQSGAHGSRRTTERGSVAPARHPARRSTRSTSPSSHRRARAPFPSARSRFFNVCSIRAAGVPERRRRCLAFQHDLQHLACLASATA